MKGNIMRQTVCAFAVAGLMWAVTYERCFAAPIAPLTRIQAWAGRIALVYSHRYRRPYIVVPLTRHYGYVPYWWPQGQYHWSPFALERWGYWCDGAGSQRLSC